MSVRPSTLQDRSSILDLSVASGLVAKEQIDTVANKFDDHHKPGAVSNEHWLVAEVDGMVAGVAYAVPEPLTDRAWNLQMIAVSSSHRRRGIGTLLMQAIEKHLADQRLLLIDTSQTVDQSAARALYEKQGFIRAAAIPNFYEDGYDKVTYTKRLQ